MQRAPWNHPQRPTAWWCVLMIVTAPLAAQMNVGVGHGYRLYRECLMLWSEGDDAEAVRKLIELRTDLGGLPGSLLDVDSELGAGRSRALIPILGLLAELHARDLRRARTGATGAIADAGDVRSHLERLAAIFRNRSQRTALARRLPASEADEILSRLWSHVAAALREATYLEDALPFFAEAMRLDPGNFAAAMSAGAIEEKLGRYGAARKDFEKVLDAAPEHPEARLRRALSILRGGAIRPAEADLEEIAAGDAPAWIRVLAFEELAQSLAERGERRRALETTLAGRELAPGDEGLLLLQVWLRGDRTEASRALLQELDGEPPGERILSPRALYNLWPADLEATLERWRRDVDGHRPLLRRALLSESP